MDIKKDDLSSVAEVDSARVWQKPRMTRLEVGGLTQAGGGLKFKSVEDLGYKIKS